MTLTFQVDYLQEHRTVTHARREPSKPFLSGTAKTFEVYLNTHAIALKTINLSKQ